MTTSRHRNRGGRSGKAYPSTRARFHSGSLGMTSEQDQETKMPESATADSGIPFQTENLEAEGHAAADAACRLD